MKYGGEKMTKFGQLKKINPRNIWPNEARDFTPWIAEHLEELGEALGMDFELTKQEAAVGDFSLDILANDLGRSRPVIIENQLTQTDHDHLGKLITYASGYDAGVIIWIAETIREEHRQALQWLNERTDEKTDFFGVTVEVIQIDNSLPAYNFKAVVFPNEWQKSTRKTTTEQTTEKMERYREYFQLLIDTLRQNYHFTNARKGQPQSWYSFSSGITGITYGMSFALGKKARVETYIDLGNKEQNKRLFELIFKKKKEIENQYGTPLTWEKLEEKRSSRIAMYRDGSIEDDDETLEQIRQWSIDNLIKMKKVLGPVIKNYIIEI
ncbi:MAG: hypothetical protein PWQ59_1311 [Thermoanaerobacterium sp.]|jgi:hypothetical protein|nr:hypothetical protein [Thermoanaerobacterium sp.]MDK2801140.1 hypothetical protein [Clostridiales bacterium]